MDADKHRYPNAGNGWQVTIKENPAMKSVSICVHLWLMNRQPSTRA
jgi:hypothetical protein